MRLTPPHLLSRCHTPFSTHGIPDLRHICSRVILLDEVLYHARILPFAKCSELSNAQLAQLHAAVLEICSIACACNANASGFPDTWLFHYRWAKRDRHAQVAFDQIESPLGMIHFDEVGSKATAYLPSVQQDGLAKGRGPKKGRIRGRALVSTAIDDDNAAAAVATLHATAAAARRISQQTSATLAPNSGALSAAAAAAALRLPSLGGCCTQLALVEGRVRGGGSGWIVDPAGGTGNVWRGGDDQPSCWIAFDQAMLTDESHCGGADEGDAVGGAAVGGAAVGGAPPGAQLASTWWEEWRERLDHWWLLTPDASALHTCLDALALTLASRLERWWRVQGALGGTSAPRLSGREHLREREGCEWIARKEAELGLPDFPEVSDHPNNPHLHETLNELRISPLPIPRLLPQWEDSVQSRLPRGSAASAQQVTPFRSLAWGLSGGAGSLLALVAAAAILGRAMRGKWAGRKDLQGGRFEMRSLSR